MINKNKAIVKLENSLLVADDISYDAIDKLMRKIMKTYDITAKELHFGFKSKHNKTPDEWIKMKRNLQENKTQKDEEGYMARVELDIIDKSVKNLKKSIKSGDQQLPAWIQSKITRAADYIDSAAEYLSNEEKVEESIVDRVLTRIFEEDECECEEKSKPVMSLSKIAKKHGVSVEVIIDQLRMGIEVEKEHTTDKKEAQKIALQHLAEKPDYYTKLKKVEQQNESSILKGILSEVKKSSKKMKGKDPCWKGYEMVGTKKKGNREVPNCVPVSEATLPVQNGHVMQILVSWRGKLLTSQLFFPQIRVPNRREIETAIVKVYPDAKVITYKIASQNVGEPLIQVPNSRSKNYLLNNKNIGEDVDYFEEDGPSLSVGRGEKLPVSRGGGLTAKGRARYNRETGSNLQAPVTGKVKRGSKAWKRRKRFCSRSRSWKGPRGLAARRRWKC